jgi:isoquinoline 1-oxidoreductase beta subunit
MTLATTRREFLLAGSAAATLTIGFALPRTARALEAVPTFHPNAWLRLTADGQVTVIVGSSEMGQGVLTAIPMLLAEELDADWSRVGFEQAPVDKAYANPIFGMQATGGSTTVRAHWEPVRQAGAAARQMLVAAAAAQWQVDAARVRTEQGVVIGPDGQRAPYGTLVEAAAKLPVPDKPTLKSPAQFRILGRALPRLDTPSKVHTTARYGIDAQLPGLKVAVMARAPAPGAKPKSVDDSRAKAVKGVHQVITLPSGVAVLADGYWAAKKGRDALAIDWDLGDAARLSTASISAMLDEGARQADKVAREEGSVKDAAAARRVQARYEVPYLAHACMEPMNCTAWVRGSGDDATVEIWAGTQSQGPAQGILANVAKASPAKVSINTLMLGGGFGRRFAPDFTIDAVLLSQISGQPVKLIYAREDDMAAGFYRPASVVHFEGGLDAAGMPTLLTAGVGSPSIMAASGFMKIPDNGVDSFAVEGLADHPYSVPNQRIAYGRREPGPQVWFWRSVGHSQNAFFIESFIDELAAAAGKDPFEYRRALLAKSPRHKAVLEVAADRAGWGRPLPAGIGRGIAVAESFGSYVAEVAEVSVGEDGTPRVHRVVAAVDCGMTVNPEIIRRQIESAIVFGLSAALYGRLDFDGGRVQQGNFNTYPVLRMAEMPKVEVHILPSTDKPGGIGEPGTPPIAPAVTGALYAVTGKRIRSLPIDPGLLRKA